VNGTHARSPNLLRSSCSIALMCTTSRRIPVSFSTNHGPEKGDLIPLWGLVVACREAVCERYPRQVAEPVPMIVIFITLMPRSE